MTQQSTGVITSIDLLLTVVSHYQATNHHYSPLTIVKVCKPSLGILNHPVIRSLSLNQPLPTTVHHQKAFPNHVPTIVAGDCWVSSPLRLKITKHQRCIPFGARQRSAKGRQGFMIQAGGTTSAEHQGSVIAS